MSLDGTPNLAAKLWKIFKRKTGFFILYIYINNMLIIDCMKMYEYTILDIYIYIYIRYTFFFYIVYR